MKPIFKDIKFFLLSTFLYSWTLFFLTDGWLIPQFIQHHQYELANFTALTGHLLAMLGPALGALISWKFFHIGHPPKLTWNIPRYYLFLFFSCFIYWALPALLYTFFGHGYILQTPTSAFQIASILSGCTLYWFAGLGEETGWLAFLIPTLEKNTTRFNALLISGAIRGIWHLPLLIAPTLYQVLTHQKPLGIFLIMTPVFALQLACSNIAFGSIFYYLWIRTRSLPLAGWLHQWYDAFRDITILLVTGYVTTPWVTLYSGFALALIASFAIIKLLKPENT